MEATEDETVWELALEAAINEGCDVHEIISICKGRIIPNEMRAQVWYICHGGGTKVSNFSNFDEMFDLPEQSIIRNDCRNLVDKLGNEEEDKVSVVCECESIFTHYCKSRHLPYSTKHGWGDILTPLLAVKMKYDHMFICFEEILEKYIPRDTGKNAPVYHLLRLLILYHDPQFSTFLDSKKITPELYSRAWMKTLFASVCTLDAILPLWDIYFQERDAFFVLFLCLVILFNAKEQIMAMTEETRDHIIETLQNIPTALSVSDVADFCSLARFYSVKTPNTFKNEFCTVVFGSIFMGNNDIPNMVGDLPLSQALCLPTSPEEVLAASSVDVGTESEQVRFFLVDCRPSEQYNGGHLQNAFHLDSNLMLQQPSSFQTAVQGLFMVQKQAVSSTPGCGNHLCFIGSGRETEDQYLHMVVASFLQKNTPYVSLAKGGYQAFHSLLIHNLEDSLSDHDSKKCIVCSPETQSATSDQTDLTNLTQEKSSKTKEESSFINRFSSISNIFKSKSHDIKGKIVDYITNPNAEETPNKHVSAKDKHKKLYRDYANVFSIQDDDELTQDNDSNASLEVVNIEQWLQKPDVLKSFPCEQLRENGYLTASHLLLTESLLFVIQEIEGRKGHGHVTLRRILSSIVRITSKRKCPELITLKYGSILPDGEIVYTDMDRFLIPNACEATHAIKEQIRKISEQ